MKKVIWKYQLETIDNQNIKMPIGSEILSIQIQKNKPCLWALVNPEKELETRFIEIYGTGYNIDYDNLTSKIHLGTYQLNDGELVFHVFENTIF